MINEKQKELKIRESSNKLNSKIEKINNILNYNNQSGKEIYQENNSNHLFHDYNEIDLSLQNLNNLKNQDIQNLLNNGFQIDADTKYLMGYVKELEELSNSLYEDLKKLKDSEVIRISKEFLTNDYQRRFSASIELVISAIVGRDNAAHEMKKIFSTRQNFYESLKLCRNYNAFESKYMKKYDAIFNVEKLNQVHEFGDKDIYKNTSKSKAFPMNFN